MQNTKLPSRHQIADRVQVEFHAGQPIKGEIMAVRFTDACVFYDVALFIISEDDSLPIKDVPADFIKSLGALGVPIGETVHSLIHDACYELAHGNIEKTKEILCRADIIAHELND